MTEIAVSLIALAVVVVFLIEVALRRLSHSPRHEPIPVRRSRDRIERINDICLKAAYHRERQEALHHDLCHMHGYDPRSDEGDEFMEVIYGGADYADTLQRIMRRFPRGAK